MANITLRSGPSGKGSPLTVEEVDNNFISLNEDIGLRLLSSTYTKEDILNKLKLVTRPLDNSGLNSDTVGGLYPYTTNEPYTLVSRDVNGGFAAQTITAVSFSGPLTGNVTGNVTGALTGNADTATKLQTARAINGQTFDGTYDITVADATKLPLTGGTLTGNLTLNADPSTDLQAATKHYVDTYGCPKGAIIMWSGTTLPTGWGLCDGTIQSGTQTPDLRNKFIYGANTLGDVKGTGGGTTTTTVSAGSHNHTGLTDGHSLTAEEIADHTHSYTQHNSTFNSYYHGDYSNNYWWSPSYWNWWGGYYGYHAVDTTETTGGVTGSVAPSAPHTHGIGTDGAHTHTVPNNLPPYMLLAYIIKLI